MDQDIVSSASYLILYHPQWLKHIQLVCKISYVHLDIYAEICRLPFVQAIASHVHVQCPQLVLLSSADIGNITARQVMHPYVHVHKPCKFSVLNVPVLEFDSISGTVH